MGQGTIPAGRMPPWDINVVVEIPLHGGAFTMPGSDGKRFDGFNAGAHYYPGNLGFVPETAMPDGEPCEVLVVGSVSVLPGAILRSRPIGALVLACADGIERARLLAVPVERLHPFFAGTTSCGSLPSALLDQVAEFFLSLKDVDCGGIGQTRPLRIARWEEANAAARLLERAIESHRTTQTEEGVSHARA